MRVLHINKFGTVVGGSEKYMIQLAERQSEDHEVGVVGAQATSNTEVDARISRFDVDVPRFHEVRGREQVAVAARVVWSRRQADAISGILDDFRPDLVHLHLYAHQLTSSIVAACRRAGTPVVHTAHDYKLVCPAYVANVGGQDCLACADRLSPRLMVKRCHHGSLPWSVVVGAEALVTRRLRLAPEFIVAPSEYMRSAMETSWLSSGSTVEVIRNPCEPSDLTWTGSTGALLYVGRLSREKGVAELINACHELGRSLRVAGDGPVRAELETQATELRAAVTFLGWLDPPALAAERVGCTAQVVPSTWPENAPLAVLEAATEGVPVVASNRGGLPEYRSLGARLVVVDRMDAPSLGTALNDLAALRGDLHRLRDELSWPRHLTRLNAFYVRAAT